MRSRNIDGVIAIFALLLSLAAIPLIAQDFPPQGSGGGGGIQTDDDATVGGTLDVTGPSNLGDGASARTLLTLRNSGDDVRLESTSRQLLVNEAGAAPGTVSANAAIKTGRFVAGADAGLFYGSGLLLGSGLNLRWSNIATTGGTPDVGLERSAAGVLEVTDGSTGNGTLDVGRLLVDGGAEATPGVAFAENPDSGIWHTGTANSGINFSIDATTGLTFNRNGADYRLQSPVGAHLLGFSRFVTNATGNTALNQTFNQFQLWTNIGASGTITFTLPSAPTYGSNYTIKRCASFAVQIDPGANDGLRYSGGLMADGEYLELASDGAYVELVADSEGNWNTVAEGGTLTEETP